MLNQDFFLPLITASISEAIFRKTAVVITIKIKTKRPIASAVEVSINKKEEKCNHTSAGFS